MKKISIVNRFFLKAVLLPAPFYKKMQVDIDQLRSIVKYKLIQDDRRPSTLHQTRAKKKKTVSFATLGTMLFSLIIGGLYVIAFSLGANMVTHLFFYFTFFFVMLSATLIADFTAILIDVRDNQIILPKPVNDRTFLVARFLHILIHILKLVIPMSMGGIIYTAYYYGAAGAIVLAMLILFLLLFTVFFINALYILLLRFTTPARFKSVISYVQIILAIGIYGGYQLVPRMITRFKLDSLDITKNKAILIYPVYWISAAWKLFFKEGATTWLDMGIGLLGLLFPLIAFWLVIRFLAPGFNNKLAMITTGEDAIKLVGKAYGNKRFSYSNLLAAGLTKKGPERMGFLFAWKMSGRSRDFKLKVYPSLGYLFIYILVMFMNSQHNTLQDLQDQGSRGHGMVIGALYISSYLLTVSISQIVFSEKFKAAWIFYAAPLQGPGLVISGSTRAAIVRFYIPLVVIIFVSGVAIIGPVVIPNILLGLSNEVLIAAMMVYFGFKRLPFSMPQANKMRSGSFIRSLALMAVSALIAIGHFFIYTMIPLVLACTVLSVIANWLILTGIRNTPWDEVKREMKDDI